MDDIARRLGMDPLELRLKNLVQEEDQFVTGDTLVAVGISECLKGASAAVGWEEKQEQKDRELKGKVRGKGLAVMIKTTMTPSNSSALVRLNADGSAVLLTSSVEIGQGTQTSLAQIVAEELGISAERVSVTFPDTDVTPFDQSTSSSRTIFTMGGRRSDERSRSYFRRTTERRWGAWQGATTTRRGVESIRRQGKGRHRHFSFYRRARRKWKWTPRLGR
jgi:carbon-monoxide dehydrogenase large subunit